MALHFRQNSMFHFPWYFVQSVCLSFEFALAIQFFAININIQLRFMQHSNFCFRHSTFSQETIKFRIRPSSSVECTFIFSHSTFSICAFWVFASDIRLWALYLQVSTFDNQVFELNFYPLVSDLWRSLAQLTWPTPAKMVVESVERLPSGVDSGNLHGGLPNYNLWEVTDFEWIWNQFQINNPWSLTSYIYNTTTVASGTKVDDSDFWSVGCDKRLWI